jgi:predicted flavoprotein YhiN
MRVFLAAFFAPKVVDVLVTYLGLPADICLDTLNNKDLEKMTRALQDIRLPVQGTRGFEYCQISAGGVPVTEVDPLTLESRLVSGLYLTGETLDVVGPCGGYNLQYAFSSGSLAGMAAAGVG